MYTLPFKSLGAVIAKVLLLSVVDTVFPKSFSVLSNNPAVVFNMLGFSSYTCLYFATSHFPVSSSSTQIVSVFRFSLPMLNVFAPSPLIEVLASSNLANLLGLKYVIKPFVFSLASIVTSSLCSKVITFREVDVIL